MSRGHGTWQRALLGALEIHDLGTVGNIAHNHLGREATRSELVAIRRAARRLAEDGLCKALHLGECSKCGELSERWYCQRCGVSAACRQVLVVARLNLTGIESVMPLNGLPSWVSVALVPNEPEATLSADGGF